MTEKDKEISIDQQEKEQLEQDLVLVDKQLESSEIKVELVKRKRSIEKRLKVLSSGRRRNTIGEIPQHQPSVKHTNSQASLSKTKPLEDEAKAKLLLKPTVSFSNAVKDIGSEFITHNYSHESLSPKVCGKFAHECHKNQSGFGMIDSCTSFGTCSLCGLLKGKASQMSLVSDFTQPYPSLESIKQKMRSLPEEKLEEIIDLFENESYKKKPLGVCNSYISCEKCSPRHLQVYEASVHYDQEDPLNLAQDPNVFIVEDDDVDDDEKTKKKKAKAKRAAVETGQADDNMEKSMAESFEKTETEIADNSKSKPRKIEAKTEGATRQSERARVKIESPPKEPIKERSTIATEQLKPKENELKMRQLARRPKAEKTKLKGTKLASHSIDGLPSKTSLPLISEKESEINNTSHFALADRSEHGGQVTEYCKKYFKVKYEIEWQNFVIDKLNRELQAKIKRCCPENELKRLRCNLSIEISRLRDMIDYAAWSQRQNRELQWGTIRLFVPDACGDFGIMPECPSDISDVSGFSQFEREIIGNKSDRRPSMCAIQGEMKSMECKMMALKQQNLRLLRDLDGVCEENVNCARLQRLYSAICNLLIKINAIKCTCDEMHTKIHLIQNSNK